MVEVFKTNVRKVDESVALIHQLLTHTKADKISFDLEDCDRILRVEGERFSPKKVIDILTSSGYQCDVLF